MGVLIPSKPPEFQGNPKDKDYAAQMQEHQEQMQLFCPNTMADIKTAA